MSANILTLDIETFPAVVESWGLFKVTIPIDHVREPSRIAMFAAKWHGERSVVAYDEREGDVHMAKRAQELLHAADIVVTYNGAKFDVPHLHRHIIQHGLTPPSPFRQVDLYRVVRQHFKFDSNKLGFVAQQLGLSNKLDTGGYDLWKRCMAGDEVAWRKMVRYCMADVRLTDKLYDRLLPWIKSHPHVGLWADASDAPTCPKCGSGRLQWRGTQVAIAQTYRRFQCQACGGWGRSTSIESRLGETRAA